MKNIFLLVAMLLGSMAIHAQNSDLIIEVTGVEQTKGSIQVKVFNRAATFPKEGQEYKSLRFAVNSDRVVCTVPDLPHGTYAVAIFHDVNDNRECDLNFVGIPTEPYAFSQNVVPVMQAPSFAETSITHSNTSRIRIKLL